MQLEHKGCTLWLQLCGGGDSDCRPRWSGREGMGAEDQRQLRENGGIRPQTLLP